MPNDPRRHLPLEGTRNLRDLGGYPTRDGGETRWRRFLRADGMHELTAADQSQLVDLGLRTVVDLRRGSELASAPNVLADADWVSYYHVDYVGEGPIEVERGLDDDRHEIAFTYCLWLDHRQEAIHRVLSTLAAPGALPALFHCAAGKDRTGVTAALLLGLAGVPEDLIVADYALSARFLYHDYAARQRAAGEPLPEGFDRQAYEDRFSPAPAMAQVLEHLDQRYGGIEAYVGSIGVTDDEVVRLRAGLLD